MPISTHKMLADNDQPNTAQIIDRASTQSSNTKTFFACEEAAPVSGITDDVGGTLAINHASASYSVTDGTDGISATLLVWPQANLTGGNWPSPGTNDYMLLVCGKATDGVAEGIGHISFYMSTADGGQMKVQPYYAVFANISGVNYLTRYQVSTPLYQELLTTRVAGTNYMFLALKRGDVMEHYADGVLTGSVNVAEHYNGELAAEWRDQSTKDATFATGHSAWGTQSTCNQANIDANLCEILDEPMPGIFSNTGEYGQEIYGLLYQVFPNGAPSVDEIKRGMDWMKPKWIVGNKAIYPGWMY